MTYQSIIKIYPYILYGTSVVFLFSGLRAISDYRFHRDKSVFNYIGLCLSCSAYDFLLSLAFFNPNPQMAMFVGNTTWVAGTAISVFYFRQVTRFINDKSATMKFVILVTEGVFGFSILNLLLFLFTGRSLVFTLETRLDAGPILVASGANFLHPTLLAEVLGAIITFVPLWGLIYIFNAIRKRHRQETLLKIGAVLSFFSFLNEMALTFNFIRSVPFYFISKGFEIYRFGRYFQRKALQKISILEDEVSDLSVQASTAFVAGSIAHDINSPLTVIMLAVGEMKRNLTTQDLNREKMLVSIEKIERHSNSVGKIIRDYLDLIRNNKKSNYESVGVSSMINNALILSEKSRNKAGIEEVIVQNNIGDFKLNCNPTQIELVLANLINNAAEAMKDLEVRKTLEIRAKLSENRVAIEVLDTGYLPPEIEPQLFQRSVSTKRDDGNGIGLRIAKKIIDKHGGEISFIRLKEGSCFRVVLPAVTGV